MTPIMSVTIRFRFKWGLTIGTAIQIDACVGGHVLLQDPIKYALDNKINIRKKNFGLTFNSVGVLNAFSHIVHLCFFSGLCLKRLCCRNAVRVVDTKPQISQRCSLSAVVCMLSTCRNMCDRVAYHFWQYLHWAATLGACTFFSCFLRVSNVGLTAPHISQINSLSG